MGKALQGSLRIAENGCDTMVVARRFDAIVACPIVSMHSRALLHEVEMKPTKLLPEASGTWRRRIRPIFLPSSSTAIATSAFQSVGALPRQTCAPTYVSSTSNHLGQQAPIRSDHGTTELLQNQPRGLVADLELSLQRLGTHTRLLRTQQPDGDKPLTNRRTGVMQNRSSGQRCLPVASSTEYGAPCCHPTAARSAHRTPEPIWPAHCTQILKTRLVSSEAIHELH